MPRTTALMIGCALFGVVMTLGFSWGCAISIQREWDNAQDYEQKGQFLSSWTTQRDDHIRGWNLRVTRRFGAQRVSATNGAYEPERTLYLPDRMLPDWTSIRVLPEVSPEVDIYGYIDVAYGWPMVCFWHTWTDTSPEGVLDGSQADSWRVAGWILPVNPIWPALYINTIFYAAISFLILRGPAVVRRYARLFKGRCPGCGIPIVSENGHGCDACGHAVTWARA